MAFIPGILIYLLLLCGGFVYQGGHLGSLWIETSDLMVLFLAPFALLFAAYGREMGHRLAGLTWVSSSRIPAEKLQAFLSLWIAALYGTMAALFLAHLFILTGFLAGSYPLIFEKSYRCLQVFPPGLLLAEGVLRPLKYRLGR